MGKTLDTLITKGTICQKLNEPTHRVHYVLLSRSIEPVAKAGNSYVYAETVIDRVRSELRRIDARSEPVDY